ncbi:MAG: tripartite tricarboxylate transporter substrate binding protein, partial [Alphaproteobacteria bacterium]|nr:tripartite tricarboxylate transporter substrate binding protein [Alphaproteobacteria bacterium]
MSLMIRAAAVALTLFAASAAAAQQPWPSRAITMVVPFTAGTTSDVIARGLADDLSQTLGQAVVIDNRGGAGGNVGAAIAAKATGDGYTFLFATTGPAATNKLMYRSMTFDPQRDFVPVVLVGRSPIIVVARPDAPFSTIGELAAYTKSHPDTLTAGFPGNGTLGHITGELLKAAAGITFVDAQYRGSPPIIADLIGRHIDIGMDAMAAYVSNVQDGTIKALAIAGTRRWHKLPDVPTVADSGLPGFEASVWYAVFAPKGTSPDVVDRMNGAVNRYLASEKARTILDALGVSIDGGTPDDLKAFTAAEIAKWGPVIRAANIT